MFILIEDGFMIIITIPAGNYSRRSFMNTLKEQLNLNSVHGWIYNISYPNSSSPDTGKFTYTVTNNGDQQPTFAFDNISSVYEQMGFDEGSSNQFIGNSLTSKNVLKFQLEDNLYINSDIVASKNGNNTLINIPSAFPDYGNIHYINNDIEAQSRPMHSTISNIYRFSLLNEDGKSIFLNGLNMTIVLMVYKKDDIYEKLRQAIKIYLTQ